jgi:hypothetical protein
MVCPNYEPFSPFCFSCQDLHSHLTWGGLAILGCLYVLFVHEYVFPFDSTCVYYPQWVGYCLCFFIRDSNFQSKWLANLLSEIFPTYTVAVFLQIVLFICQYPGVWDEARGAGDCSHDRLFRATKLRETNWSSNKRRNRLSWIDLPFFLDHCIYLLN